MSGVDSRIPEYSLEEREKEILIIIVAPLSEHKEAAFVVEKDVFIFECPPYLLKLNLPCPVSDKCSQSSYDNVTGTYKIKYKKFEKVCQGGESAAVDIENGEKQFYGFANMYSNILGRLCTKVSEVVNLPDPDHTDVSKRKILREKEENEKWNDDHYLADTMETSHLQSIFEYKPPWITSPVKDELRDDECEELKLIDNSKITQLSEKNVRLSEFQIVDILLSYAYNVRTTEGENTVESNWTINKLSATLCWLEIFDNLKSVVLAFYRRSLIYPLYRNWNLTQMIHKDVINLLKTGPKQITRCLLEIKHLFSESDYGHIHNLLYINDLCHFAFCMTDKMCLELSEELGKISITKSEVNSDLPLLEMSARLVLEEEKLADGGETDIGKIVDKIGKLQFENKTNSSTDSSESDEEDSSESSDSED